MPATIAIVGPPKQASLLSDADGTPATQPKYQIKAEMHIYPNILPSIINILYLQCDIRSHKCGISFWDTLQ
jgi:hypothetical protein